MTDYNASGLQCMGQGQFQEAILWFKQALDDNKAVNGRDHPIVLFNLGNCYAASGQFALAIEFYLLSIVQAPQYELTRNSLNACLEPCLAEATDANEPNIARLLAEFRDNMEWKDVLENPSSTKEFLHFWQATRLCKPDTIVLDNSADSAATSRSLPTRNMSHSTLKSPRAGISRPWT